MLKFLSEWTKTWKNVENLNKVRLPQRLEFHTSFKGDWNRNFVETNLKKFCSQWSLLPIGGNFPTGKVIISVSLKDIDQISGI